MLDCPYCTASVTPRGIDLYHVYPQRIRTIMTNLRPSRRLRRKLLQRLVAPINSFKALGDVVETQDGPLIHIDRGSNVLAVAHLDWVAWEDDPWFSKKGRIINAGQLDDRLGVWTILDVLPALGINCDVLLTDSEEIGRSTATDFLPTKDYNWMFQFDRRGGDVVLYDYESESNVALLESYGFEVGAGSFSDICWLNHMGITGFNIGTGYQREHSKDSYADLRQLMTNVGKFRTFYNDMKDIRLPAPPVRERVSIAVPGWDWRDMDRPGEEEYLSNTIATMDCPYCEVPLFVDEKVCYCCHKTLPHCTDCATPLGDNWDCPTCYKEREDMSLPEYLARFDHAYNDLDEDDVCPY